MIIDTDELLSKARAGVKNAGATAVKIAESASDRADAVVEKARLNKRILDLRVQAGTLKKQIGGKVYEAYAGGSVAQEDLDKLLSDLDKTVREIELLRNKVSSL